LNERAGSRQFDPNFSFSAAKRVARRIGNQLMNNHPQAPALVRRQGQRTGLKHKPDLHVVELRAADGLAKAAEMRGRVQASSTLRDFQSAMDVYLLMQTLGYSIQNGFDLFISAPRCGQSNHVDDGRELVVDPVVQFAQEHSFPRGRATRNEVGHTLPPDCRGGRVSESCSRSRPFSRGAA
jgi:hypothetical protein